MIKLLKAGFFRLKKDSIFWLFVFLTIGIAGFTLFRYASNENVNVHLDKIINEFIMYIGLFIAIFVSIFVGKEHSQGIIRNKIIVGHSRISIFLANLIISIIGSILCEIVYLVFVFLIGIPLFGQLQMSLSQFAIILLNTGLIIISFCSIFNFISMICSEITVSTTICIILFITMFIAEGSISLTANTDKYITHTYTDENGVSHIVSQELDPNYPGDEKVKQARMIYLSIPQGQAMEIGINDSEYLKQMPIYSIILICAINILGIYVFCKKELK